MSSLNYSLALWLFGLHMDGQQLSMDKYSLVCDVVKKRFQLEPRVETILFLIGVQELGHGLKEYTREEKMDLIQLGTMRVLSHFGLYEKAKEPDRDNWPIYQRNENQRVTNPEDKDLLIKKGIVAYFESNHLLIE